MSPAGLTVEIDGEQQRDIEVKVVYGQRDLQVCMLKSSSGEYLIPSPDYYSSCCNTNLEDVLFPVASSTPFYLRVTAKSDGAASVVFSTQSSIP